MARVAAFVSSVHERERLHETKVECVWHTFTARGETILQLDTYGSDERQIPGKVSQTLQLDRETASSLVRILRDVFPGL